MSGLAISLLILLAVMIALFSNKVPMGVVGMSCIVLLLATNVLTAEEAFAGFSNTNVAIMAAMMVLSDSLMHTSLLEKIVRLVGKVGNGDKKLVLGFGIIYGLMAQFMSAFVALACLVPIITGMCREYKISISKVVFPIAIIGMSWAGLFPVGIGAGTFAQMNSYLEAYGSTAMFGMADIMRCRLPGAVIITVLMTAIGPKLCPAQPSVEIGQVKEREIQKGTLSRLKDIIAYVVTFATIAMMLLSKPTGIPTYLSACTGALLMVIFGIESEKQAFTSINWGFIFMFAGILPLATALTKTGASEVMANFVIGLLGGTTNPWIISSIFVFIVILVTQFMSNTACTAVFMPLAAMISVELKMNPVTIMGLVSLGCTISYLTPMAWPGIPITMAAGGYSQRDCIKIGLIPSIVLMVTGIIWISIAFPAYG